MGRNNASSLTPSSAKRPLMVPKWIQKYTGSVLFLFVFVQIVAISYYHFILSLRIATTDLSSAPPIRESKGRHQDQKEEDPKHESIRELSKSTSTITTDTVPSILYDLSGINVAPIKKGKRKMTQKEAANRNNNATVATDINSDLSPPNNAIADAVLTLNDEPTVVIVGGFVDYYQQVTNMVQFFNIETQLWDTKRTTTLPPYVAETHQGISYDSTQRVLYIVSGQKGNGCKPATREVVRYWLDQNRFERLPLLPEARYSPGVEIVVVKDDETNSSIRRYLHVFGGTSENRKDGVTDHWRLLIIDEADVDSLEGLSWERMDPLPDAGVHGTSFITSKQDIYYTAYCRMDQGVTLTETTEPAMSQCHREAVEKGQILHHTTDVGLTFRYSTGSNHWERVADMPFPTCHGGSLLHNDVLYYVGGGLTDIQTPRGSAPNPLPMIQTFDSTTEKWQAYPFKGRSRATSFPGQGLPNLFAMISWIDPFRQQLYGVHPGRTMVSAQLIPATQSKVLEKSTVSFDDPAMMEIQQSFLHQLQSMSIPAFEKCAMADQKPSDMLTNETLNDNIEIWSILDQDDVNRSIGYDLLRGTWNERYRQYQYPDIIALPKNAQHISTLVKCARQTGYRLCARNGKHSYDGSSICSRGVLVDMSNITQWEVMTSSAPNDIVVKVGAGITLGRLVVALETIGLALPTGSCPSVGATGLIMSGGQAQLSRLYGLTCDHLYAIDLIDAEGQLVHATRDNEYSDYLWLARGGGIVGYHFPAIVTTLYFKDFVNLTSVNNENNEKVNFDKVVAKPSPNVWTKARIDFPAKNDVAVEVLLSWHEFLWKERQIEDQKKENLDEESLLSRRIIIEPWMIIQRVRRNPLRQKKQEQEGNLVTKTNSSDPDYVWEKSLFLTVHFFGSEQQHKEYFMPKILPMLQSQWTSTVNGTIHRVDRLDHLEFSRKLGGVQNNEQLASGIHGHDLNHQSWKGYSTIVTPPSSDNNNDIDQTTSTSIMMKSILETYVRDIWEGQPYCKRYAEFRPLGGAIREYDFGAYGQRNGLWTVLDNHFYHYNEYYYPSTNEKNKKELSSAKATIIEKQILNNSQQRYENFIQALSGINWFGGMYAGYVEHTKSLHEDLQMYYGQNDQERIDKIISIKRTRDPYNIFRRWLPYQNDDT